MGIEVVQNEMDTGSLWIDAIEEKADLVGEVYPGTAVSDGNMSPRSEWLKDHEQVRGPIALILGVLTCGLTRLRQGGRPNFVNELFATFVKAHHRFQRVIRSLIHVQHLFHIRHERSARLRDAPFFYLPGFKLIFLSVWRTVSYEILSTTASSTSLSASKRTLHRAWLSGRSLHTNAMRYA